MNDQNLIPFGQRSESEQREIRSKGGKASQEAQRKKRTMRELARLMLDTDLLDTDGLKQELIERGFDPTGAGAILYAQLAKAGKGDTEAARFVRDTSGQKPIEGLELGNLDDKPFESLELSSLSDEDLKRLAAARRGEDA